MGQHLFDTQSDTWYISAQIQFSHQVEHWILDPVDPVDPVDQVDHGSSG